MKRLGLRLSYRWNANLPQPTGMQVPYLRLSGTSDSITDYHRSLHQDLNKEQLSKVLETDLSYRNQHIALEASLSAEERDAVRRRRMIYRSKQRGWLEVDILLGSWATKYVPQLTTEQLDEYELVLKEETIDIYNFVSGKDALPERLRGLSVIKLLQDYAYASKVIDPDSYERIKKEANLT
jgi:succinate dehydrogenase assembly factor 2